MSHRRDRAVEPTTANELRALVAQYARATDTFDGDLLAACFVEDGTTKTYRGPQRDPLIRHGSAQLATAAGGLPGRVGAFHHLGQTTFCYADDDPAALIILGEIYCDAYQLARDEAGAIRAFVYFIRYQDRYTLAAEQWKIIERKINIDFEAPANVHSVMTTNWPTAGAPRVAL